MCVSGDLSDTEAKTVDSTRWNGHFFLMVFFFFNLYLCF